MNLCYFLLLVSVGYAVSEYVCSHTECYDCIREKCHLTCQGKDCSTCPDGSCCKGTNCNVCVQSVCCDSTRKCNECVSRNKGSCSSSKVDCETFVQNQCGLTEDNQISTFVHRNAANSDTRYPVKTLINITNVINHTNYVDTPIKLNIKEIGNITLNADGTSNTTHGTTKEKLGQLSKNCCGIVHPKECFKFSHIPDEVCFRRRHTECSNVCGNSTDLLIQNIPGSVQKCIFIQAYPYFYCGYFTLEDCSSCYNCGEDDGIKCLKSQNCSESCKDSVLPQKFYNRPYHTMKDKSTNTDTPTLSME